MEKQIIIRIHDITNDKPIGFLVAFDALGQEMTSIEIEHARVFKNKEEASLYYTDGTCKEIGRINIMQKYIFEEVESKIAECDLNILSVKQLIEDYQRRVETINSELKKLSEDGIDYEKHKRLNTKAGCYRTFISELERIINGN